MPASDVAWATAGPLGISRHLPGLSSRPGPPPPCPPPGRTDKSALVGTCWKLSQLLARGFKAFPEPRGMLWGCLPIAKVMVWYSSVAMTTNSRRPRGDAGSAVVLQPSWGLALSQEEKPMGGPLWAAELSQECTCAPDPREGPPSHAAVTAGPLCLAPGPWRGAVPRAPRGSHHPPAVSSPETLWLLWTLTRQPPPPVYISVVARQQQNGI